jgi:hypothetical protein
MATIKKQKSIPMKKEFPAGTLFNPYLCKGEMVAKKITTASLELSYKGIDMGKHWGKKL